MEIWIKYWDIILLFVLFWKILYWDGFGSLIFLVILCDILDEDVMVCIECIFNYNY